MLLGSFLKRRSFNVWIVRMIQTWGHRFIGPKHLQNFRTFDEICVSKMIQLRLWKIGASSQPTGLRANTLSPLAPTSGATCIWEMSPIANQPGVIPSRRPSTDVSNRCRRGKNASPQKNAVVWHFGWVDFGDKLSNHFSHLPNPVVRVQNALQSKCFLHSRVGYSMLLFSCLHAVATGPLRCKTDQQTTWTLYLLNCKSWTLNDFLILFGTSALCSANHSLI